MNILDLLFILILIALVVATYKRGFIDALFSKLSWIGGAVLALLFTPIFAFTVIKDFTKLESEPILYFISFSILFLIAFFSIKIIGHLVGSVFELPVLSSLNHVLGALFVLLVAIIIISIILVVLLMQNFVPQQTWMKDSKLAPFFIQYLLGMNSYR